MSATSIPSHSTPGTPKPSPLRCRSVTAECRSSDVPIPNWLFVTMKTTGSLHSAARFIVSPNVPWFDAPSPNMQSVASSVLSSSALRPKPAAIGRLPPTIP